MATKLELSQVICQALYMKKEPLPVTNPNVARMAKKTDKPHLLYQYDLAQEVLADARKKGNLKD